VIPGAAEQQHGEEVRAMATNDTNKNKCATAPLGR